MKEEGWGDIMRKIEAMSCGYGFGWLGLMKKVRRGLGISNAKKMPCQMHVGRSMDSRV
jgi:hypothetical protein